MHISFVDPAPEKDLSLACKLGVEGSVKFRTMASGIHLTYEDNEPELIQTWVAEPKRIAIIEAETDYRLTSKWVLA